MATAALINPEITIIPLPDADLAGCGGHGSKALSRPMREDSPAARITPQKAVVRAIRGR